MYYTSVKTNMVYNIENNMSVIIIFVVYSSYTYGQIWENTIKIPDKNVIDNCPGWMEYHGFDYNESNNIDMAKSRNKMLDRDAYVYAATYAFFISSFYKESFDQKDYSITGYCQRFLEHDEVTSYIALKDAEMICDKWIISYGYLKERGFHNSKMAPSRYRCNDKDMHIWALMYTRYSEISDSSFLRPSEFCWRMGNQINSEPKKLPFVTIETTKTCEEWIMLSEYSNDTNINMKKAWDQNLKFVRFLSKWTVDYIKYLRAFKENPPSNGCYGLLPDPKPDKPGKFCRKMGYDSKHPVHYDKI